MLRDADAEKMHFFGLKASDGRMPLEYCLRMTRDYEVAAKLISIGADLNCRESGKLIFSKVEHSEKVNFSKAEFLAKIQDKYQQWTSIKEDVIHYFGIFMRVDEAKRFSKIITSFLFDRQNLLRAIVLLKKSKRVCMNCGVRRSSQKYFKTCAVCRRPSYCSRDCQISDWEFHKLECSK